MKAFNKRAFVLSGLRRMSYRWPSRYLAQKAAKVERGLYFCNICGCIDKKKNFQLDHVIPVIPIEGFGDGVSWDWNQVVERMMPDEISGYQMLCKGCHQIKTKEENLKRVDVRRARKKENA